MSIDLPGVDINEGVRRTGGCPALYVSFLKRFPQDSSFSSLTSALAAGDICQAFLSAHSLKGLSAQLGISALHEPANGLCDLLRSSDPAALEPAKARLAQLTPIYERITTEIENLP